MLLHPANLIYWILLGFGVALSLLVILSGRGGVEAGTNIEVDLDANLERAIDASATVAGSATHS
ncbi:hypothetical protein [Trichothermofontia sp.]